MLNQIYVLFDGYSYQNPNNPNIMIANCTCTLIKGIGGYNVVVDTMTPWDKEKIIQALEKHDLTPEDINAVVCTHGHADHIGNNNLFVQADWHFVGQCPFKKDNFYDHNFGQEPFILTDDIKIVSSPGHTLSCVSVIINNTNLGARVAICGDLFEREDDIENPSIWLNAGSENSYLQKDNRLKIAKMVDFIIPGHGPGFPLNNNLKENLKRQLDS